MVDNTEERRLAAILAADVVGYSRLMGEDEAGTLAAVRKLRSDLIEPRIVEHKGRLFKAMGDGFLAEFPSVVNAVACAAAIQKTMTARNADLPQSRQMDLRIGVHLGDVIAEGGDVYGDGVNIAARLEALAPPGGVAVSAMVHENIGSRLDLAFEDFGEQYLKNVTRPIRVYQLATFIRSTTQAKQAEYSKPSIAVLPFTNMSSDPEQEFFADGIAEDILTELSRYPDLAVVSRNSSFAYKGKTINAQQAGRELYAEFLLEGSVRRVGNRVRITAQLIDCATGKHVWAERYDRSLDDIFALQDEIVSAILDGIVFNMPEAMARQRLRNPTSSTSAYTALLQARAAWRASNEPVAIRHAQRAIDIDPTYAEALAFLAARLAYSHFTGASGLSASESKKFCQDYAARALSIDDQDPFVLMNVALAKWMTGETAEARPLIAASRKIMPRDPYIMQTEGEILAFSGEHNRGLALMEASIRYEPRVPIGFKMGMAEGYYLARRYQEALGIYDSVIDMPWYAALLRSVCLGQLDQIEMARHAASGALAMAPPTVDPTVFARNVCSMCVLAEDADNWSEGFRKAGIET